MPGLSVLVVGSSHVRRSARKHETSAFSSACVWRRLDRHWRLFLVQRGDHAVAKPGGARAGQAAHPAGRRSGRAHRRAAGAVEAVGLVTGLHGTGSDPGPSPQRAALLEEMQARDVANPNAVLASGNVSLVLIQGYLRPGIQKGDRFDIEVRVPSQSETTSLRGGYLLETRLAEMAVLDDNQLHHGNAAGAGQGTGAGRSHGRSQEGPHCASAAGGFPAAAWS